MYRFIPEGVRVLFESDYETEVNEFAEKWLLENSDKLPYEDRYEEWVLDFLIETVVDEEDQDESEY